MPRTECSARCHNAHSSFWLVFKLKSCGLNPAHGKPSGGCHGCPLGVPWMFSSRGQLSMKTSLPITLAFSHPSTHSQLLWSAWDPVEHCSPVSPHPCAILWVLFSWIHLSLSHESQLCLYLSSGTRRKPSTAALNLCRLHLLF